MAETSIGIKIADGTFFPVLDESIPGRKRVILTTVKDNQTGAQIDLYRGNGTGIAGATYLGSLVIDEIERAPKGDPEIELIIRLDEDGNLDVEASDYVTGEHQTLSIALASVAVGGSDALPEFGLDERYHPALGVSPAEVTRLTAEPVSPDFSGVEEDVRRQRTRRTLQSIGVALIVAVIIAAIVLLILWFMRRPAPTASVPAASPAASSISSAASTGPSQTTAAPAPVKTAPAKGSARAAVPPPTPQKPQYHEGGVQYQIRWGDTLWDLSISFYRTPWLYGKIAKANNIKNPNLIFAYTQIYIPPR